VFIGYLQSLLANGNQAIQVYYWAWPLYSCNSRALIGSPRKYL
jgi:hypothetical protein